MPSPQSCNCAQIATCQQVGSLELNPSCKSGVGMPPTSRRDFIKTASAGAILGASLSSATRVLHANPLGLPLGCQTWPVREMISKDFPGTLKELSAAGFQTIELCSPVGYAGSGFAG